MKAIASRRKMCYNDSIGDTTTHHTPTQSTDGTRRHHINRPQWAESEKAMKTTNANNQRTTTTATTQAAATVEARLHTLAAAYAADPKSDDTAHALYSVCIPAVHSVLNRCLRVGGTYADADAAAAAFDVRKVSASSVDKLRRMKADVAHAAAVMAAYDENAAAADAIGIGYDEKGRMKEYRIDGKTDTQKAAAAVHAAASIGGDGMDLVHTAIACLLSELQKAAAASRSITDRYTAVKPPHRTVRFYGCGNDSIALTNAVAKPLKECAIIPIQVVYRAIRAAIRAAAAIDTKTVYLQDLTENDIDSALYAICPFAYDMGIDAVAAAASLDAEAELVKKMNLTPAQKSVLDLLRQGHSYTTAAAMLKVSTDTIRKHRYAMQSAAVKAEIAPPTWIDNAHNRNAAAAVVAIDEDGNCKYFKSKKHAAAVLGIPRSCIYDALRTGKPTHGYTFTAEK